MLSALKLSTLFCLLALPAAADPPVIEAANADGLVLSVTLSHPDTGWDHYANSWEVRAPDGRHLDTRVLVHPHVTEQPFTRSLRLKTIPAGMTQLDIVATCNENDRSESFRIDLGG